jgi:glycosyltransferase involved in cell wall biosynthesis
MKIGIEAQRIFRKNKHGMDFVILEEIRQIQLLDENNEYFIFVKPGPDRCLSDTKNVHIIEVKCPTYPLWEQIALPHYAKKYGVDILHCTSNTAPIKCKRPLILTLHDIIFLEPRNDKNKSLYQNMGWLYRRYDVPRIIHQCKKVITVSKFEYERIHNRLRLPDDVLMYIYNGYNEHFQPIDNAQSISKKYIQEQGFFLFFGNTDPKKNTINTLKAYSIYLKKSNVKRKLLIADIDEAYVSQALTENGIDEIKDFIVISSYIKNSELPYIYNSAFAFLYTSLRESFGIPLLEAMACGTPVITSNTSSMPEIVNDSALLVNPEDINDIAEKMLSLESDQSMYQTIKERGLARVRSFSWKISAEKLIDVYNEVYNQCTSHHS